MVDWGRDYYQKTIEQGLRNIQPVTGYPGLANGLGFMFNTATSHAQAGQNLNATLPPQSPGLALNLNVQNASNANFVANFPVNPHSSATALNPAALSFNMQQQPYLYSPNSPYSADHTQQPITSQVPLSGEDNDDDQYLESTLEEQYLDSINADLLLSYNFRA